MWVSAGREFVYLAIQLTGLFLVISLVINLLQQIIPYNKVESYLASRNPVLGALVALLFAFITPFCSCSTILIVTNMLQKKMRFAMVMIFLFTSPVLDPAIVTLMGFLLGWKVALIYTAVTSAVGVLTGFALEKFGFQRYIKEAILSGYQGPPKNLEKINLKAAMSNTLKLTGAVLPYLLLGAVIGSGIKELVPTEWLTTYLGGNKWWLIPVAAVVGIPLYTRLSTMVPISQILIVKGMALGPVMALVISSAGASLPELAMLNSIFRKEMIFVFVLSVIAMATLSGTIFYLV